IRDLTVTGVQTCALPISESHPGNARRCAGREGLPGNHPDVAHGRVDGRHRAHARVTHHQRPDPGDPSRRAHRRGGRHDACEHELRHQANRFRDSTLSWRAGRHRTGRGSGDVHDRGHRPAAAMTFAWSPSDRYLARSRLRQFAEDAGHNDFASLHRWSVDDLEGFWRAVDRDIGFVWRQRYERVFDSARGIPWTTWWLGGRMNFVASALRHDPSRTAIIFEGEEGLTRRLTYGELATAVGRCAAGLRALGVKPGDRVGIFLPLTPECAIATLAVAAIGAIYTPIFSGYASDAIAGRLRVCEASV